LQKAELPVTFFGMAAQAMNCPNCGAAVSSEATRCEHCNSRLATVACPSCFGMIFKGAKYCSHCGARADRHDADFNQVRLCPRCKLNMEAKVVGEAHLCECPKCEGVWADTTTLKQICTDREQQAAVLGAAITIARPGSVQLEKVRYVPCPICQALMNRVNFAKCSNVIVDVCRTHGTWFDKDELRRIVEFIRSGGMDLARQKEMDELDRKRRALAAAEIMASQSGASSQPSGSYDIPEGIFGLAAGAILSSFLD